MSRRFERQGGWAGSFVAIGIILVLLLLGGVYILKTNEIDTHNNPSDSQRETSTSDSDAHERDTEVSSGNDKDEERTNNEDTETGSSSARDDRQNSANDNEQLPQTGPGDAMMQMVAASLLAFSGVAYVRSRTRYTL